jgi:hypothetical protein
VWCSFVEGLATEPCVCVLTFLAWLVGWLVVYRLGAGFGERKIRSRLLISTAACSLEIEPSVTRPIRLFTKLLILNYSTLCFDSKGPHRRTSRRRQRQTRVHSSAHVSVLRAHYVDDDFLVEVGEHALQRPVEVYS